MRTPVDSVIKAFDAMLQALNNRQKIRELAMKPKPRKKL
jgi:hypothetical protein